MKRGLAVIGAGMTCALFTCQSIGQKNPAPQVLVEVVTVTGDGSAPRARPAKAGNDEKPRALQVALQMARANAEQDARVTNYLAVSGPLEHHLVAHSSTPVFVATIEKKDGKEQAVDRTYHYGATVSALVAAKDDTLTLNLTLNRAERDEKNTIVLDGKTIPGLQSRTANTFLKLKSGDTITGLLASTNVVDTNLEKARRTRWETTLVSARLLDGKAPLPPLNP